MPRSTQQHCISVSPHILYVSPSHTSTATYNAQKWRVPTNSLNACPHDLYAEQTQIHT